MLNEPGRSYRAFFCRSSSPCKLLLAGVGRAASVSWRIASVQEWENTVAETVGALGPNTSVIPTRRRRRFAPPKPPTVAHRTTGPRRRQRFFCAWRPGNVGEDCFMGLEPGASAAGAHQSHGLLTAAASVTSWTVFDPPSPSFCLGHFGYRVDLFGRLYAFVFDRVRR